MELVISLPPSTRPTAPRLLSKARRVLVALGALAFLFPHGGLRAQAVSTVVALHTFSGGDQGAFPTYGLICGNDGNFYGITARGGTNDTGSLLQLTPAGGLRILFNFPDGNNRYPTAGIIQASDGAFYGPAQHLYDPSRSGLIYRLSTRGEFSVVHLFAPATEGADPQAALTQGRDGNFYGTTTTGGPNGNGTIFKLTTDGRLTVLYAFANAGGGASATALAQGSDGNFYGSNSAGLFRITPTGEFTSLNSLGTQSGLLLGSDGNLYGTSGGGNRGCGAIVRVTPAGERTGIYNFYYPDGYVVNGPLVQGADGNFYGTTASGGNYTRGTVFRCTPDGELTVLHSFSADEPSAPHTGAVLDHGGAIYGVSSFPNGSGGSGTFFRLDVAETHPPFFVAETPLSNGVYYLNFSEKILDNSHFGYYAYLSDPNYIYHFDLGYEYLFDANDGQRGIYLYDFASNTFFYTSPVFAFPYLYDFTLNAVLYYYPDPNDSSRYNTNGVRYFYNYATRQIITK